MRKVSIYRAVFLLLLPAALLAALTQSGCTSSSGNLAANPRTLNFGNVVVGSSSKQNLTLANSGTSALTVTQAVASGKGFAVRGPALPLTLGAGQTAAFTTSFAPTTTGSISGSISITSSELKPSAERPTGGSTSPTVTTHVETITVNGAGVPVTPSITTGPLPNAQAGIQFQASLNATGGVQPYHWSIATGALPSGLSLNADTGLVSGTASRGGQFDFSVQVSDSSSPTPQTAMKALNLTVLAFALQIAPGTLPSGQVGVPFQTTLTGNGGVTPYTWAVTGALPTGLSLNASSGAIAGTPTQAGTSTFTVVLTDSAQQTVQQLSGLTILAAGVQPLAIATTTLPNPITGQAYSATLHATGGTPPYTWSVASGQLPSGLTLTSASGQIAGTSSQVGSSTVSIQAKDSAGQTAQKPFTITTSPVGPALPTLPQATVDLNMPTQTGTVWNVPAGDAATFQKDINSSTCGDTIVLVAGSTYSGNFTIPNKVCSGWILIESSAVGSLPASGHRVGPSNAPNMATISTANSTPAFEFLLSSNHWRLIGLKITTSFVSTSGRVNNLVLSDGYNDSNVSTLPSFIIFDRDYILGLSNTNVTRGIQMDIKSFGVVDSYCDEIHDNGFDSQCFAAWNSPGPFLIQNNFIQAAGESVFLGGADPAITNSVPSDATIVGNLIQKNVTWRGQAAPLHWVVKNHIECKNGQRVLIDGNVLQYTWQGGQGEAIIIRSVSNGAAPWSVCQDFTITHNLIQHAPMGAVIVGSDSGFPVALATQRVLVQNNVLSDISSATWGGHGWLFQVGAGQNPAEHDIIIDHNTGFDDQEAIRFGSCSCTGVNAISNFQVTNNIFDYGLYGIAGDGTASGTATLTTYAPGYIYNDNVFTTTTTGTYPPGTFWGTNIAGLDFTGVLGSDPNLSGNFQLAGGNPYRTAGTDGHDIGVWDWTVFNTETTNALNGNYLH